ncbi:MAG: bifunctional N(6)-L-threonylcarbamoyladenine synthase/serine/threonine protein kinase [Candidatus Nanohaloarchaea archaeon]|nr:bifunctional N(6)-L-threonylcarbamoyladenine synthase/serine/threonine protein kinase [Candidatus Nanohaloarchaea archaeon]
MITLGIESTAHTFGAGVCEDRTITANERSVYEPEEGGIHPRKASEHHYANAKQTIDRALQEADSDYSDIDAVAFARGPGLPQCLQIGGTAARSIALNHEIPLVDVNHPVAHIEIGKHTTGAEDPVTLYVSGGNSQILAYAAERYRVFGETQDIAIGNALDKFARKLGIPHPGGPEVERLAGQSDNLIELPYVVKGMDFSFSGLVTEVQSRIGDYEKEDLCHSFQEHAFAMLVEATERAMAHLGKDEALLTGGVAANKRLQEMLNEMAEARDAEAFTVPHEYAMDNGAMIAYTGELKYRSGGTIPPGEAATLPDWRTDEEEIQWLE